MKFSIPSLMLGVVMTLGDRHGSVVAAGAAGTGEQATATMSNGENANVSESDSTCAT
jgi:hypothetical protein